MITVAEKSPVALFIFRRPQHTKRVLQSIREYAPPRLYVIADGARPQVAGEAELVIETRRVIDEVDWPCEVITQYAESNLGLRQRILTGLDFVFDREESAVILEDDCVASRSFFHYCQELLSTYASDPKIGMISGANFAPYRSIVADYHFSRSPYIWGWATWARVWHSFRSSPQVEAWDTGVYKEVKESFATKGQAKAFLAMMGEAERLHTWDVSLAVWFRLSGLLAAVPRTNLVKNIGFGTEATHTKFEAFDVDVPAGELPPILKHPSSWEADSRRERIMWRSKQLKWITFPLLHPVDFSKRFLRYLRVR